jgi:hypothetical protein
MEDELTKLTGFVKAVCKNNDYKCEITDSRTRWMMRHTNANRWHMDAYQPYIGLGMPITFVLVFGKGCEDEHSTTFVINNGKNVKYEARLRELNENRIVHLCQPSQGVLSVFPSHTWHSIGDVQQGRFTIVVFTIISSKDISAQITWGDIRKSFASAEDVVAHPCQQISVRDLIQARNRRRASLQAFPEEKVHERASHRQIPKRKPRTRASDLKKSVRVKR